MCRTIRLLALAILLISTASASATVVTIPNDTLPLPPVGGTYTTPTGDLEIIGGLTQGDTIQIDGRLQDFSNTTNTSGGTLGGEIQTFDAVLQMSMQGMGTLSAYSRGAVLVPVSVVTHTAPRTVGAAVQSFDTEIISLSGTFLGDPDFNFLTVIAGTDLLGPPSPGYTTLTRIGSGPTYNVDSFFDVTYQIEFQGAPGSPLDGLGGLGSTTIGTVRFQAGEPVIVPEPCTSILAVFALAGLALVVGRRRR